MREASFVVFLFVIAIGGSFLGLRCSSGWFAHNNNKKKKTASDSSSTKVALALSSDEEVVALLNTTMCSTKCGEDSSATASDENKEKDCQTYLTPIRTCYSSSKLFPEDPSWSGYDMFDTLVPTSDTRRRSTRSPNTVVSTQTNNTAAGTSLLLLVRTIYQTINGTCVPSSQDTVFRLELQQCVGPFGRPRPWGLFSMAESATTVDSSYN